MKDLAELRHHVSHHILEIKDLDPNPLKQCERWIQFAAEAGFYQPNAMTLGTVSSLGQPSLRVVLLKDISTDGFIFYTNYESRKAQEMAGNQQVGLLFYWDQLERQIRIEGKVKKVDEAINQAYFATRPRESQIGAWASPQSMVIPDRELLLDRVKEVEQRYIQSEVPCPLFWGGYLVVPDAVEFWQGQAGRLHDRLRYVRQQNTGWKIERLAP